MSYPLYGNVIVDSSNSTALGGTLTISNSCKTSSLNNQASIAFAVADISYGTLNMGLFNNNIDTADARITAIIDTVSPTVGTGLSVSVSSNHANPPVEALRVQSNGNVGIGTTNPVSPLHVFRSTSGTLASFAGAGAGGGGNNYNFDFCAYLSSGGIPTNRIACIDDGSYSGHYAFYSKTPGADTNPLVERMRMASNGSVGIGTTVPQSLLEIAGTPLNGTSTNANHQWMFNMLRPGTSTVQNATSFGIRHGAFDSSIVASAKTVFAISGSPGAANQWGYIPDVSAITMQINNSGALQVGIGTSNPNYSLHVNGIIGTNNNVNNKKLVLWDGNAADTPSSATNFYGFGINNGMLRYQVDNNTSTHAFFGGSTEFLRIQGGSVGIGTTNPIRRLHVNSNGVSNGIISENAEASTSTARDTLLPALANNTLIGPAPSSSLVWIYWKNSGGTKYYWTGTGTTMFTGQHMVVPDNSDLKTNLTEYVGLIVSSNDSGYTSYYNSIKSTGIDAITICEALPNCKLSDKDNDKAVFGVITNQKNDEYFDTDGSPLYDNIDNGFEKSLYDRIRVNSVGEGSMWVTNINGSLENGDYITSSAIPGYGKRQNDDLLHNYTVAKSTMSCDFILDSPNYKTKSVIWEGNTYIAAFIGCTYHCG